MDQFGGMEFYVPTEQEECVNEDYENVFLETTESYINHALDFRYHHLIEPNLPNIYFRHVIPELTEEQLESLRGNDDELLENKLRQLSNMLYQKGVIKDYNLVQNIGDKLGNSNEVEALQLVRDIEMRKDKTKAASHRSKEIQKGDPQKFEKEIKKTPEKHSKNMKKSKTFEIPKDPKMEKKRNLPSRSPSAELKRLDKNYMAVTPGRDSKQRPYSPDAILNINRSVSTLKKARKGSSDANETISQGIKSLNQLSETKPKKKKNKIPPGELESEKTEKLRKHQRTKSTTFVKSTVNSNKSTARFYRGEQDNNQVAVEVTVRCFSPARERHSKNEKVKSDSKIDESQINLLKILKRVKKFINKDPGDDTNLKKLENLIKGIN